MTRPIICPHCHLPQVVTPKPSDPPGDVYCPNCGGPAPWGPTPAPRPTTVLCIDDDPLVLHFYRTFLAQHGYRVLTATDGLAGLDVRTLFIEPGSPWENGYCEAFNGKLRDELLDRELFYTLREAQVLVEGWRQHYNTVRPHSALGYRPPAPEVCVRLPLACSPRLALELAGSPN